MSIHDDPDVVRRQLVDALALVNRRARRYRRLNTTLVLLGILCGAAATLLGADAAFGGSRLAAPVAAATTGKVPPPLGQGWKNVCALIAIITFVGTVATGVNNGLRIADRNSRAFSCAGAIDALLTELPSQPSPDGGDLARARSELARMKRDYPEHFR